MYPVRAEFCKDLCIPIVATMTVQTTLGTLDGYAPQG